MEDGRPCPSRICHPRHWTAAVVSREPGEEFPSPARCENSTVEALHATFSATWLQIPSRYENITVCLTSPALISKSSHKEASTRWRLGRSPQKLKTENRLAPIFNPPKASSAS